MRGVLFLAAIIAIVGTPVAVQAATPAFSVHKNGTNQTVAQDTDVKLTWTTEGFDTNDNFASDRFTPTVAGKYLIVVSAQCMQAGACMPSIYKNGALVARSQATNINIGQTPQATTIVDMNGTTDYVEAFINSAGSIIGGTVDRTYFSGVQLDGGGGGSAMSTASMVPGWPDAIKCTSSARGESILYLSPAPHTSGSYYYFEPYAGASNAYYVEYQPSGEFASSFGLGTLSTCNVSIAANYAAGRAFDFIGGSSQWVNGPSGAIYYNGGNVGIGTTISDSRLEVYGTGASPSLSSDTGIFKVSGNITQELAFGQYTAAPYAFWMQTKKASNDGSSWPLAINPLGGNVGIGTTDPARPLHVNGAALFGSVTSGSTQVTLNSGGTASTKNMSIYYQSGSPSSAATDHGVVQAGYAGSYYTNLALNPFGANVGIGTENPTAKLHLASSSSTGSNALLSIEKDNSGAGTAGILWSSTGSYGFMDYNSGSGEGIRFSGLGPLRFGYNSNAAYGSSTFTEVMRTTTAGRLGIGEVNPTHILHIAGQGRATTSAWATSSDRRVKEDILSITDGLEAIDKLRPVTFRYTEEYQNGNPALAGVRRGFIAQEVEAVLPDIVTRSAEKVGKREIQDFRVLGNSDFVPLLVSAVKELKAANDNLRAENDDLRSELRETTNSQDAEIDVLRRRVEALKAAK